MPGRSSWGTSAAPDDECRAAGGRLKRTLSTRKRGLVLVERDASDELEMVQLVARIALGRCMRCKSRTRVLPCDVLPRKTYGTSAIEHSVASHSRGNRSLRQVAWSQLGERTPAHTTLHGWSEGLGAHALGRRAGDAGGAPASRFLAEAEAHRPAVAAAMRADVHVDPRRYRSGARHERLVAVARLLAAVIIIAATLPHPFAIAGSLSVTLSVPRTTSRRRSSTTTTPMRC